MSELQYVGARYVPKFFDNPDGSWNWEPRFQYEPLTIVKYGENTYTSKMLVPDNIGAPNLNPDYWANTGNYNGAINSLQTQINMLTMDVNQLNNKVVYGNAIYIGNSYTYGVGATDGKGGMYERTKHIFSKTYANYANGAGLFPYTNHSVTYLDLLRQTVTQIPMDERKFITDVIYICAVGENRYLDENPKANGTTFLNKIKESVLYIRENLPNATLRICLAEIQADKNLNPATLNIANTYKVHTYLKIGCTYANAVYLGWISWDITLQPFNSQPVTSSDGYHPNNNGYNALSGLLISALRGRLQYGVKHFSAEIGIFSRGTATILALPDYTRILFSNVEGEATIDGEYKTLLDVSKVFFYGEYNFVLNIFKAPETFSDGENVRAYVSNGILQVRNSGVVSFASGRHEIAPIVLYNNL